MLGVGDVQPSGEAKLRQSIRDLVPVGQRVAVEYGGRARGAEQLRKCRGVVAAREVLILIEMRGGHALQPPLPNATHPSPPNNGCRVSEGLGGGDV